MNRKEGEVWEAWLPSWEALLMGFIENHPSNIPVVRDPCRPSRKQRRDSSQGWGTMVRSRSVTGLLTFQRGRRAKFSASKAQRDGGGKPCFLNTVPNDVLKGKSETERQ